MIKVLCIVLTNSANQFFVDMTNRCIDTMIENKGNEIDLKCIVVETNDAALHYNQDNTLTIYPSESFKYNRFMNLGYKKSKDYWPDFFSEKDEYRYVVLANNDLVFHQNWASELANSIYETGFDSGSPISPGWQFHAKYNETNIYEGFGIGHEFCGWLQMYKKSSFDKLYPLDEDFEFWCADNSIIMEMQKLDMKHALFPSSKVTHLTSSSHSLVPYDKYGHWTQGMCDLLGKKISEGKYDRN